MMRADQGSTDHKEREEESGMIRTTIALRHKHLEFLLCSLKKELRVALQCPEKMRVRDLKRPVFME